MHISAGTVMVVCTSDVFEVVWLIEAMSISRLVRRGKGTVKFS